MPAEPAPANSIRPAVRNRSVAPGDVPDGLGRRYYTDGRGGAGLGFYVDARVQAPAFRDLGRQLVAARCDPNAVRDMIAIARHRGWTSVRAKGSSDFRREAWLVGAVNGLEVRGYRPTTRDVQELERRRRTRNRLEIPDPAQDRQSDSSPIARSNLRILETVVRARLVEKPAQERVLAAARTRLARWLEQGRQVTAVPVRQAHHPQTGQAKERTR